MSEDHPPEGSPLPLPPPLPPPLPTTPVSRAIDRVIRGAGVVAALAWPVLIVVVVGNVVLRYLFGWGLIQLEELQWHVYACGFLLGLADAVSGDEHVRVDVVHARMTPRARAWVELYGTVLLLVPFALLVVVFAVPFVARSFSTGEVSGAPGGLPYRWAIKAMLPVGFVLVLLAAGSRCLRLGAALGGRRPDGEGSSR